MRIKFILYIIQKKDDIGKPRLFTKQIYPPITRWVSGVQTPSLVLIRLSLPLERPPRLTNVSQRECIKITKCEKIFVSHVTYARTCARVKIVQVWKTAATITYLTSLHIFVSIDKVTSC